jgi:hypothetical protein
MSAPGVERTVGTGGAFKNTAHIGTREASTNARFAFVYKSTPTPNALITLSGVAVPAWNPGRHDA